MRLAAEILAGVPRLGAVRLVTIDGPSGSGKSTLGGRLRLELGGRATLVPTDHFATWDDPFEWWDRLEAGVLQPFAAGQPGRYVANDWSSGEPVPNRLITVTPGSVLIIEGVSAGRRAVADRTTLSVWVEYPDRGARRERAVARDGEQIRSFLDRWQAAEDRWFADDDTRNRSDRRIRIE